MEFHVENFGKVRQADVRLDGITVITGENGSGKSTISRVLTAWCSFLRQIDKWIGKARVNGIYEKLDSILSKYDLRHEPSFYMVRRAKKHKMLLDRAFWSDDEAVMNWLISNLVPVKWELYDRVRQDEVGIMKRARLDIAAAARQIIDESDDKYEQYILEAFWQRAFDGHPGSMLDPSATTRICLISDRTIKREVALLDGKVVSYSNIRGNNVTPSFYVEPRHLLDVCVGSSDMMWMSQDANRYGNDSAQDWVGILYEEPQYDIFSLDKAQAQEKINQTLESIVKIIHGRIKKDGRTIKFWDVDVGGNVSINNIASGAKTMAALIRGLGNGRIKPGDLVVIDEPESNLHPEWQVEFAQFLVLLNAKFDFKMLLNTHSPFFLKAIRTYSDLWGIGEKCAYYNMEKQGGDKLYTAMQKDEKSIETVFADMARPYARLIYGENYDGKKLFGGR